MLRKLVYNDISLLYIQYDTVVVPGRVFPSTQVVKSGKKFKLKCDSDPPVLWYFEFVLLPNVSRIIDVTYPELEIRASNDNIGKYTCEGQVTDPIISDFTIKTFHFKSSATVRLLGMTL